MTESLTMIARAAGVLAIAAIAGFVVYKLMEYTFDREIIRRRTPVLQTFLRLCAAPGRVVLPLLGIFIALPLALEDRILEYSRHATGIALIAGVAWLLLRILRAAEEAISARLGVDQADNLDARRTQTQLRVIRSILAAVVVFGAATAILFTFPQLRQLGAGILASAGLAGIIVGLAAQKVLANLLAGFQVGFTQPIRLDDVVVVEGEWGRVEEITLTYVVVRIWDERRLVLPISYFLEKPFANWTRQSAELLGSVFLYLDYRAPIAEIRAELERIVAASELWDGRVCRVQVTDAKEHTIELRALVSARNSGSAFELRCEVREKLLQFIRDQFPEALPRFRAELNQPAPETP